MSLADLMRPGALRLTQPRTITPHPAQPTEPRLLDDPEFSPADVDRWSWPHGEAMNGTEIDRMISRVDVFMRRSLTFADAERLADTLMRRDREEDDRRVCLECTRLRGRSCGAPALGGMGSNVSHVALILQRCPAFQAVSLS